MTPMSSILSMLAQPGVRRVVLVAAALLLVGVLLYGAALLAIWRGQERLLFLPVPLPPDTRLAREPDVHERFVDVPGARLSVLELRLPQPAGVVFFLHGNAGNLESWFVNAAFYRRANFDLVMLDYRGYGKSTGRIESEAQLHEDVWAVWQSVAERYRDRHVVIYGRSLGTALAAVLAERVRPDLTLLVSPYASMVALAHEHYRWVPPALLRYPLRTDASIGRIDGPVLLVHGERDDLITPAHSQALQALARSARSVVVPGAGHGDLQDFDVYLRTVADALAAVASAPVGRRP
jgi:pimeloyl-ACP methyl ester carboxylesterase